MLENNKENSFKTGKDDETKKSIFVSKSKVTLTPKA